MEDLSTFYILHAKSIKSTMLTRQKKNTHRTGTKKEEQQKYKKKSTYITGPGGYKYKMLLDVYIYIGFLLLLLLLQKKIDGKIQSESNTHRNIYMVILMALTQSSRFSPVWMYVRWGVFTQGS